MGMGMTPMSSMAGGSDLMYNDPLLSRGMPGGMGMGGMSGMSGMGFGGGGMMGNPMMMNQQAMMNGGGGGFGMGGMPGAYRESQAAAAGDMEFQRLRQIQQMHMLDRQMGQGSMSMGGSDPYDRMRFGR